jgi:glycosyltransferase involved in cell wall biosynthesis
MIQADHGTLADVAILIPAYNCQADLERTLRSFDEEAQVQVLIIDDGSLPPIVAPVIDGLSIEILRLQDNGGIERALATGIDALAVRGVRYAARIDAGDLALPGRFAKQAAHLDTHPDIAAVGMWAQVVARDGTPRFTLTPPAAPAEVRRRCFARLAFVHPAMMLRVEAVRRVGNYRAKYRAAEDLDLFLRLMRAYDCANLPEPGLVYELNEGGISAKKRRTQVISTLRLQFAYFAPANPYWWIGLVKNALHFVTPYRVLQSIKRALFHPRARHT